MLNKIFLQGRLVADPELRHTQQGTPVASFRLAVDRDFKSKDPNASNTDFINIVAWRGTGEFVSRYFTKGRMAIVEGRLQMREYTDRDGNPPGCGRGGGQQCLLWRLPPRQSACRRPLWRTPGRLRFLRRSACVSQQLRAPGELRRTLCRRPRQRVRGTQR